MNILFETSVINIKKITNDMKILKYSILLESNKNFLNKNIFIGIIESPQYNIK